MDVKQLKYFVTIVECASFSQASRQLNIAQPALSQQISRLEYEVGAPLFVRSSRGVSPTSKGYTLYRHAKFILRQIDQALLATQEATAEITGRVTIGMPPTTVCQLGVPLVERLQRKYPGIVLNIVEGLSGHLQTMAENGNLDLVMLFVPQGVTGWTALPILREELYVVFPADAQHFPKDVESVSLRELTEVPLILPSQNHGLRRRIDLEYERLEMSLIPIAEIDSLAVLMTCLLRGMGATIKPKSAMNVFGAAFAAQWRCLPIRDIELKRVIYIHSPPTDDMSEAIRAMKTEMTAMIYEQVNEETWSGVEYIGPEPSKV
jgi:LysR family tcuABC transcriptional regulator